MSTWTEALGWSLVHFLWQGTLIAAALELVLLAIPRRSAELRYLARCAGLALMGAAPLATLWVLRAGEGARPAWSAALVAARVPEPGTPWPTLVVLAWSLGASLFAARLARDYLRVRALQRSDAGGLLPAEWQARFDVLARHLGVRATARLVESARLTAPTVIGWLAPVVLIPVRVLTGLDREQVEALIAHELAHVRRHDFLVNLVQSALEALLFYHPAVWWVSRGIRAEREYCCDDVALGLDADRISYARALATLESWRVPALEAGMSALGGPLMLRIQRLVGIRPSGTHVRGPLSALVALLVVGTLGAAAAAHTPQHDDELETLEREVDAMQARLDALKERLARARAPRDEPLPGGLLRESHDGLLGRRAHDADQSLHLGERGAELHRRILEALGEAGVHVRDGDGDRRIDALGPDATKKLHEHLLHALRGDSAQAEHDDGGPAREPYPESVHEHVKRLLEHLGLGEERRPERSHRPLDLHLGRIDLEGLDLGQLDLGQIDLGDLDLGELHLGRLDLGGLDLERLQRHLRRALEPLQRLPERIEIDLGKGLREGGLDLQRLHEDIERALEQGGVRLQIDIDGDDDVRDLHESILRGLHRSGALHAPEEDAKRDAPSGDEAFV